MNKLISKGEQEFLGQVIKVIEGGFGDNKRILFDTQIAQIHGIENKHVRESIKNLIKKGRFIENVDYINIKSNDDINITFDLNEIYSYQMLLQAENLYALSYNGYCKLVNNMSFIDNEKIGEFIKEYFEKEDDFVVVNIGKRKENLFIDDLEVILKALKITEGVRQYSVLNYRIDYYIPTLGLAIEYDEEYHNNTFQKSMDKDREEAIKKELGCDFIRLSEDKSNLENIEIIVSKIMKTMGTYANILEKEIKSEYKGTFLDYMWDNFSEQLFIATGINSEEIN